MSPDECKAFPTAGAVKTWAIPPAIAAVTIKWPNRDQSLVPVGLRGSMSYVASGHQWNSTHACLSQTKYTVYRRHLHLLPHLLRHLIPQPQDPLPAALRPTRLHLLFIPQRPSGSWQHSIHPRTLAASRRNAMNDAAS